jgi:HSP20 family protein
VKPQSLAARVNLTRAKVAPSALHPKEDVMKSARAVKPQTELLSTPICPMDPENVQWIAQETQLQIARRAYELFEARGGEHGHDWEDWFRAESELVRPVSIAISENDEQISLRANVMGFDHDDLKIAVEPERVTIFARKKERATGGGKGEPADLYPDQILQCIALPSRIDPRGAVIVLRTGVLNFELPKALQAAAQVA